MKKILLLLSLLVAAAVGAGVYFFYSGGEIVVAIPERDIAAALSQRFPIEQRKANVLETSLTNPSLKLHGGSGRMHMDLTVEVDVGLASIGVGRSERGAATISSGLRYDREAGTLMLDGTRIEELRVAELPDEYREAVEVLVSEALARHVDGLVVYELSSGTYAESLAKFFLKDVRVTDGALEAVLGIGP